MEIEVYNGNIEDSLLEKIAKGVYNKIESLGYKLNNNCLIKLLDPVNNAERLAEYEMPIPSWYLGQQFVLNQFNQGGLYEFIDHSIKGVNVANYEYVVSDSELFKGVTAHVIGHWYVNENNIILNKFKRDRARDIEIMKRYRKIKSELIKRYGGEGEKALDNIITKALSTAVFDLYPELTARVKEQEDYFSLKQELPAKRIYDIGEFVCSNSPKLNNWEKEICSMTLEVYKPLIVGSRIQIMHEGFATFLQKKHAIMDNSGEQLAFVSDITHPYFAQFPYSFGLHLFEYISRKHANSKEIIDTSIKYLDDVEWIATYADNEFIKEELTKLSEEMNVSELASSLDETLTQLGLKKKDEKISLEDMFRKFILFELFNRLPPRLYIPPRSINNNRELHLVQEIYPLVSKIVNVNSEKELMESDIIKGIAPIFTLNNSKTKGFISILSELWGGPVYLHTIDVDGKKITLVASHSGEKIRIENNWNSLRV